MPISPDEAVVLEEVERLRAENARLREALRWCVEEGGWRLFYHAFTAPPEGVFDRSDTFNVRLVEATQAGQR